MLLPVQLLLLFLKKVSSKEDGLKVESLSINSKSKFKLENIQFV